MSDDHAIPDHDPSPPPTGASGLHVLAMPIGPICNLDCAYCYYLDKKDLYAQTRDWRMDDRTLETFVRQYIAAQPPGTQEISFGWQGGEPTLLPLEFYERAVELQARFAPPGVRCTNTLQTNGVLLDDSWCAFFKQHEFLIGVSIDGPAALHDKYRRDRHGRPTHAQVVRGVRLLQKHGVEFNALTVVNRENARHPLEVYHFLRGLGVRFVQFIPIVEPVADPAIGRDTPLATGVPSEPASLVSPRSVRPAQFGRFLIEIFEDWVRRDVGQVFVQIFDQALAAWAGVQPGLCIFRPECGRALALEHNGDLYSCDHFVEPASRLGNIHDRSLAELASSTPAGSIRPGQVGEVTETVPRVSGPLHLPGRVPEEPAVDVD